MLTLNFNKSDGDKRRHSERYVRRRRGLDYYIHAQSPRARQYLNTRPEMSAKTKSLSPPKKREIFFIMKRIIFQYCTHVQSFWAKKTPNSSLERDILFGRYRFLRPTGYNKNHSDSIELLPNCMETETIQMTLFLNYIIDCNNYLTFTTHNFTPMPMMEFRNYLPRYLNNFIFELHIIRVDEHSISLSPLAN